jgi:hypothetical protein
MSFLFFCFGRVQVAASALATRQGSTLSGLRGLVTEIDDAPSNAKTSRDVTVRFMFGSFDPDRAQPPGYTHTFPESELLRLVGDISPDSSRISTDSEITGEGAINGSDRNSNSGSDKTLVIDAAFVVQAEKCLGTYDLGHRTAAKLGGVGLGGGVSANEWAEAQSAVERASLRSAVQRLLVPKPFQGEDGSSNSHMSTQESDFELQPYRGDFNDDATKQSSGPVWCERVTLGICAPNAAAGVAALKR